MFHVSMFPLPLHSLPRHGVVSLLTCACVSPSVPWTRPRSIWSNAQGLHQQRMPSKGVSKSSRLADQDLSCRRQGSWFSVPEQLLSWTQCSAGNDGQAVWYGGVSAGEARKRQDLAGQSLRYETQPFWQILTMKQQ